MNGLKPEIKKQWVAALRSGKYRQGRFALKQGREFCCLGMLCDLYGKAHGVPWSTSKEDGATMLGASLDLPGAVIEWAFGAKRPPHNRLVAMNDDEKKSFAEIADYIEEVL